MITFSMIVLFMWIGFKLTSHQLLIGGLNMNQVLIPSVNPTFRCFISTIKGHYQNLNQIYVLLFKKSQI